MELMWHRSSQLVPEAHEAKALNPHARSSYFVRGASNLYFNNSEKTRLLVSPHTDNPLHTPRHCAKVLASRGHDEVKWPTLDLRKVSDIADFTPPGSSRGS